MVQSLHVLQVPGTLHRHLVTYIYLYQDFDISLSILKQAIKVMYMVILKINDGCHPWKALPPLNVSSKNLVALLPPLVAAVSHKLLIN